MIVLQVSTVVEIPTYDNYEKKTFIVLPADDAEIVIKYFARESCAQPQALASLHCRKPSKLKEVVYLQHDDDAPAEARGAIDQGTICGIRLNNYLAPAGLKERILKLSTQPNTQGKGKRPSAIISNKQSIGIFHHDV
eukprot:scaffold1585_cov52-Attheya_sp.AAC.4